jgi:hypothetical protein
MEIGDYIVDLEGGLYFTNHDLIGAKIIDFMGKVAVVTKLDGSRGCVHFDSIRRYSTSPPKNDERWIT